MENAMSEETKMMGQCFSTGPCNVEARFWRVRVCITYDYSVNCLETPEEPHPHFRSLIGHFRRSLLPSDHMRPLSTDDLRQRYLDFFAKNGHAVIPSASLIPENDPTTLFTGSGM